MGDDPLHPASHLNYVVFDAQMQVQPDQVSVKVLAGAVLEESHYYPFGLTLSQQSLNDRERNDYKLTTKKLESSSG